MRAAMASWAKVSALDSSVGAPPTPFFEALTLRPGGTAGPPSMERIREAAAPVTMRTGLRCTRARSAERRPLFRPRSASAALHGALGGLPGDPHHERAGTHGLGAQQRAVQDEVRGTVDQHRVLAAGRLVLAAVDDDDRPDAALDRRFGDRAQLLVEGEPRAAAAPEVDAFGELRELLTAQGLERPVHLEVHGQIEPVDKVEARRELGKADHADFGYVGQGLVHL
ncbi:hypothetical protein GCM10023238_28260 [Streptomyces heliomycini]